ncbi:DUF1501 domain-containing protein [Blastopirellula sp. JC732]|uniref:DUF1501 domain-containing protein n=1 Tax=Blastopirellula sediminis TaxID=2894196 RepID=A0A9X1MJP9_9BACT|nr:DUF1501 domain-containing protein [Blastopirellula sediminis]MCC9608035.1 DUF1501 domain-containing protein [Blastopirellula sediminis]MCC9627172.1 DUF1501 domain-containing protein [Blastopirellula sediminis]
MSSPLLSRRSMLQTVGGGFGMLGLSSLLAESGVAYAANSQTLPHFPPKAKRVIYLFMSGGPSQIDTFDPKPGLAKYEGQRPEGVDIRTERKTNGLAASPVKFTPAGESGIPFSEFLPKLSKHADEMAIVRSMHTDFPNHAPALCMMNLGTLTPTRPSLGSWLTYGLGSENRDLPGYLTLCPGNPVVGPKLWGNAFLPGKFQGTYIDTTRTTPDAMIPHLRNSTISASEQKRQLELMSAINHQHLASRGDDRNLETRINAMELAYRMQFEAMEAFDVTKEPQSVREAYGSSSFAQSCLLARRLTEHGVRMVQIYYGNGQPWDTHSNHHNQNEKLCRDIDQPIAQLLTDLKQRGLLDETLVVWGGEFGRTPTLEGGSGRDHNPYGFTMWLAGGGIKGGTIHGATDEFGFRAVHDKVHVHDLHATILHLMGINHEKLTYRYSGRDFRLTDVHGRVVTNIVA